MPTLFLRAVFSKFFGMHTIKWGWAYLRKKITVNMPPLKSSLIKPSKSMLFFHIWNANFSVTPINSQMYMTKPKQVQKKLSENTGKTFSVIMPSFTCRGWAYLRKLLYIVQPGILACKCNPQPPHRILALDDNLVGTRVGRREDLRINVANFECPVG